MHWLGLIDLFLANERSEIFGSILLGLTKSYVWFQNRTSALRKFDSNLKYDFGPKLHDTKFNLHLMKSTLKPWNVLAQIQVISFVQIFYCFGIELVWRKAIWLVTLSRLEGSLVVWFKISHLNWIINTYYEVAHNMWKVFERTAVSWHPGYSGFYCVVYVFS